MKKVGTHDQFNIVLNEDGTVMHTSSAFDAVHGEDLSEQDAISLVNTIYNNTKLVGSIEDVVNKLEEGYAELNVSLPDKRNFRRYIFVYE